MAKQAAYGTRLHYTDPNDSLNNRVHYVADISGPEIGVETIDATTHDSADQFAEFLPGQADGGEVSFDLMFDPDTDGHAKILDLITQRAIIPFRLYTPRPDVEFIPDPGFDSEAFWGLSGPVIAGGLLTWVSAVSEDGLFSTEPTGLVAGEEYTLKVDVSAAGSGQFEITYSSVIVGILDCSIAGIQTFRFTSNTDSAELIFTCITSTVNITLASASLKGMATSSSGRFSFSGMFTKAGAMFPVKDALKASVSIKVSGKPTYVKLA